MSTSKSVPHKTPFDKAQKEASSEQLDQLPSADLDNVELTSLELDVAYDVDCDPYNRTGEHFVDALRRKHD